MNRRHFRRPQVVVLAAGLSTRLGQPKALARVRGETLLQRTMAAALRLDPAAVVIIAPPKAGRYRQAAGTSAAGAKNILWVANPLRSGGLSTSVRKGIVAARHAPAILFLPVDLALLKGRELERLLHRWQSSPRRLVARRIGRGGGAPLILPRWMYSHALARIDGDSGLRELVEKMQPDHRPLVDMPSAALDIDTPQDLRQARRRFRQM